MAAVDHSALYTPHPNDSVGGAGNPRRWAQQLALHADARVHPSLVFHPTGRMRVGTTWEDTRIPGFADGFASPERLGRVVFFLPSGPFDADEPSAFSPQVYQEYEKYLAIPGVSEGEKTFELLCAHWRKYSGDSSHELYVVTAHTPMEFPAWKYEKAQNLAIPHDGIELFADPDCNWLKVSRIPAFEHPWGRKSFPLHALRFGPDGKLEQLFLKGWEHPERLLDEIAQHCYDATSSAL